MLKVYVKDYGWRGSTVVIAESREEAVEMMRGTYNFDKDLKAEDLEEYEITPGVVWEDLGDT